MKTPASPRSKLRVSCERGFGFMQLLVTMGVFSVAMVSLVSLNLTSKQKAATVEFMHKIYDIRIGFMSIIQSPDAWIQTAVRNGASMTWGGASTVGAFDPTGAAYGVFVPPAPPYTPGLGAVITLYDAQGNIFIHGGNNTGIDWKGRPCGWGPQAWPNGTDWGNSAWPFSRFDVNPTHARNECQLRYEARWYMYTIMSNPIIAVNLRLRWATDMERLFQVAPFAMDMDTGQLITRQLYLSWTAEGLNTDSRYTYLNMAGLPNCVFTNNTPSGEACATPGRACRCTGACTNGNGSTVVYRCK